MIYELDIKLDRKEVLRYLGYREGMEIPYNIEDLISQCINKAYDLFTPKGAFKTVKIKSIRGSKILFDEINLQIESENIATLLKNSDYATIMAVTIGDNLQIQIDSLFKDDEYTEALIFDAIGSEGAERSAEELNRLIKEDALTRGYELTDRFSPGYGDFSLDFQQQVSKELQTENFGLHVTETNILLPRKSVTAIIGWTKEKIPLTDSTQSCKNCNLKECQFRKNQSCTIH